MLVCYVPFVFFLRWMRILYVSIAFTLVKITRAIAKLRNQNPTLIRYSAGIHLTTSELKQSNGAVVHHGIIARTMGKPLTDATNPNSRFDLSKNLASSLFREPLMPIWLFSTPNSWLAIKLTQDDLRCIIVMSNKKKVPCGDLLP